VEVIELLSGKRQPSETSKAIQACNDWLRLGPGRSLNNLLGEYARTNQNQPPTTSIATLKGWSTRYGWQDRAEAYDAEIQHRKTAYAESIMKTGLALAHERVFYLKELAHSLAGEIWDDDGALMDGKVWLNDAKVIGSGAKARYIKTIRFNHHLFEQFRGVLDDIAKETGGRKHQVEHSGPGGSPIRTEDVTLDDRRRARRIAKLLGRVKDRASRDNRE
jgi:hypothetical protein